jgi:hypothetical protein
MLTKLKILRQTYRGINKTTVTVIKNEIKNKWKINLIDINRQ